jgi:hypothetical protein
MYLLWHLNQNFREFQKFQKISKSRENVQKGTEFQKEKRTPKKLKFSTILYSTNHKISLNTKTKDNKK